VPFSAGVQTETARRSVVPPAAGRSVWLAAAWTGAGTALVAATIAIAGVALCWLPASHGSGNAGSAIRAGLLTFLAAVHGGITVAGTHAAFVPLGLTVALGAIAWRAGSGLADAVADLGPADPVRLALAGAAQLGSFVLSCLVCVPLATLGTSNAPFLGVGFFAALLFACTGGVAYVRATPLGGLVGARVPEAVRAGGRAGVAALLTYAAAGALAVAASLALHHAQVERLVRQVGPGWNAAPVLLLCVLAAPNAVVAAAALLSGPGFAVGSGTTVAVGAHVHGLLPAFPVLAGLPADGVPSWLWWPVVLTAVAAGGAAARSALRESGWIARLRTCLLGAATAACGGVVLAWLAGGGIGSGRLRTIGPSPWQFGLALGAEVAIVSTIALGAVAGWAGVRAFVATVREPQETPVLWAPTAEPDAVTERLDGLRVALVDEPAGSADDADGSGRLAG
jgi:hypothetical protein